VLVDVGALVRVKWESHPGGCTNGVVSTRSAVAVAATDGLVAVDIVAMPPINEYEYVFERRLTPSSYTDKWTVWHNFIYAPIYRLGMNF